MAATESTTKITLPASGDLSTKKYYVMVASSSGAATTAGTAGIHGVGVLQNKPTAAGQAAEIATGGRVPAIAGAAFNANVGLMTTNAGKLVTATSGNIILATSLEVASGDGSVVDVLWNPRGTA